MLEEKDEAIQERKCLCCGGPVTGRSDKRFCCSECRSAFHNQGRKDRERHIRKVNSILRRNWVVLGRLNVRGTTRVPAALLRTAGLDLRYHTSRFETRNGKVYWYCYDRGYCRLNDREYLLVNKKQNHEEGEKASERSPDRDIH